MALGSIAQKIVDEHKERERQKMMRQAGEEAQKTGEKGIIDGEEKLYSAKSGEITDAEDSEIAEDIAVAQGIQSARPNILGEEIKKEPWERCKYFKHEGGRDFCKQFMSFCVKEKCNLKTMRHIDDPELRKKYLKGEKRQ